MSIFEEKEVEVFEGYNSCFRDILWVTQSAAIASAKAIGFGDKNLADSLAVKAMREALNALPLRAHVVMGEGAKDQAPLIALGERVGQWKQGQDTADIAIDPLEGTRLCAQDRQGAWSVLALAPGGTLQKSSVFYMDKIACGPKAKGVLSLRFSVEENIQNLSQVLGLAKSSLKVAVLNRPRHQKLIARLRALNVRLKLLEDGDLLASIQSCLEGEEESGGENISAVMGIGGTTEGLLAACALKCLGGDFQGRVSSEKNEDSKKYVSLLGEHLQPNRLYTLDELVGSHVVFCGTAITESPLLSGVKTLGDYTLTESVYMDSYNRDFSIIKAYHPPTI